MTTNEARPNPTASGPYDGYTPSTAEVREGFSVLTEGHTGVPIEKLEAAFDRWHEDEIRKAKVEALREARDDIPESLFYPGDPDSSTDRVRAYLARRADEVELG